MENSSVFDWEQAFMEESLLLDENFVEIEQIELVEASKTKNTANSFASLWPEEMDKILDEKHSKGTKRTTNWDVATFNGRSTYLNYSNKATYSSNKTPSFINYCKQGSVLFLRPHYH